MPADQVGPERRATQSRGGDVVLEASQRRTAGPRNLIGAAEALSAAASTLQKVPPGDRLSWYVAAAESAGVIAAAANTTTDDWLRRDLIKAWQAINRATPAATSVGIDVAPGNAALLSVAEGEQTRRTSGNQSTQQPIAVWPQPAEVPKGSRPDVSTWLSGASRVLMAARLTDAQNSARAQALLVQAIELAAQITRTIAAQQHATAAQQRAAAATARALATATAPARPVGWQFSKDGTACLRLAEVSTPLTPALNDRAPWVLIRASIRTS